MSHFENRQWSNTFFLSVNKFAFQAFISQLLQRLSGYASLIKVCFRPLGWSSALFFSCVDTKQMCLSSNIYIGFRWDDEQCHKRSRTQRTLISQPWQRAWFKSMCPRALHATASLRVCFLCFPNAATCQWRVRPCWSVGSLAASSLHTGSIQNEVIDMMMAVTLVVSCLKQNRFVRSVSFRKDIC